MKQVEYLNTLRK